MGPLGGDVGTKQKSHVKYFISLWGSFIIFPFFKKGVDISKWSAINDFNFTFIEGSFAIFFFTPGKDHLSGSNTTQPISLEFILGHSCWPAEAPLGPTKFLVGFCPQWGVKSDVKRCFLPMVKKIMHSSASHLTGQWLNLAPNSPAVVSRSWKVWEIKYLFQAAKASPWVGLRTTWKACYTFHSRR